MRKLIPLLTGLLSALSATNSYAADPYTDFLSLDDEAKIAYLEEKTALVEDDRALEVFAAAHSKEMAGLHQTGISIADVWIDTILEGPYALTGEKTVTLTGYFAVDGQLFAMTGLVSAPAVFTDNESCEYDESADRYVGDCPAMRITEVFFIDADGKFIESDSYAEADE